MDYLRYFTMDWDDNILHMPTKIHMDKLVNSLWIPTDVSTTEFVNIRKDVINWRYRNSDPQQAFEDFRDNGSRPNSFFEDTKLALDMGQFGLSYNDFIECLIGGHIFCIITSRGHEPDTIRRVVEYIIYTQFTIKQRKAMMKNLIEYHSLFQTDTDDLIKQYLDTCYFIGIQSNWFKEKFGVVESAEKAKTIALGYFVEKINRWGTTIGKYVKLGFSDDDSGFLEAIENFIKNELSLKYITMDFYVYDSGKKKLKINYQKVNDKKIRKIRRKFNL